jgi:hypothetical protein
MCFFLALFELYAQSKIDNPSLKLDLPVFDFPYQINAANIPDYNFLDSFTHPGMKTSLAVTSGLYSAFHFGMKQFKDYVGYDEYWKKFVFNAGLMSGDMLLFFIPPGYMWLHESFHRAMFTQAGLRSHINYAFPTGAYTISDSFDVDYWPLVPRVFAAGIEGEYLLLEKLQMNNFFYEQNLPNESLYWLSTLQAWLYAYSPMQNNNVTMEVEGEKRPVSSDTLLWAYYLFHSWADTSDDVVIQFSDLTGDEQSFLRNRVLAGLINFVSPAMLGIRSIPLGKNGGGSWNFALRHYYTSFGTDSSIDFYLKLDKYKWKFSFHNYINYEHYFPAVEAELIDYPARAGGVELLLSPRGMAGMQPKDQRFKTSAPEFFGLLGLRTDVPVSKHLYIFCDITAKTAGWVAGNEDLNGSARIELGISARF